MPINTESFSYCWEQARRNVCPKCGHNMRFHYLVGTPIQCDHEDDPTRDEQCCCVYALELLIKEADAVLESRLDAEIEGIEQVVERTVAPWRDESWEGRYGN